MKLLPFFVFILFIGSTMAYDDLGDTHQVQEGESLSSVAYKYCRKVYGKSGFIYKIKQLNPKLFKKIDIVHIGVKLRIPSLVNCPLPWSHQEQIKVASLQKKTSEEVSTLQPIVNEVIDGFLIETFTFFKVLKTSEVVDKAAPTRRIEGINLISRPLIGIGLSYVFNLSMNSKMMMKWGINYEDYQDSDSVEVSSSSVLRQNFSLGINHQKWFLQTGFEERTMVDRSTFRELNLTSSFFPKLQISRSFSLHEKLGYELDLNPYVKYLLSSTTQEIKAGQGLGAGVSLNVLRPKGKFPLQIQSGYHYLKQSTNITDQNEHVVDFSLGFSL